MLHVFISSSLGWGGGEAGQKGIRLSYINYRISRPIRLLDDLKDRRGYSHLKEEALDRTMWRNRFRGGFGPVVRQNTE